MAGYCLEHEVGVEQFFRDVTIALTCEGTNGIQAYALNILIYFVIMVFLHTCVPFFKRYICFVMDKAYRFNLCV